MLRCLDRLSGVWGAISAISAICTATIAILSYSSLQVPDIYEKNLTDARKTLESKGFKLVDLGRTRFVKGVKPGLVVEQSLKAGSLSLINREVLVTISIAKQDTADIDSYLIANYKLDIDSNDSSNTSESIYLKETKFCKNNQDENCKDKHALYLNGRYEYGGEDIDDGYVATAHLRQFEYNNFTVALDFYAYDFEGDHRTILVGGTSYRWFSIRRGNDGNLELTLNNQDKIIEPSNGGKWKLETDKWYRVICSVNLNDKKVLTMLVFNPYDSDKQAVQEFSSHEHRLADGFKLEVISSPAESTDKNISFTNYSDGSVFHGLVRHLRVYSKPLTNNEMKAINKQG